MTVVVRPASAYQRAQLAARASAGRLTQDAAQRVQHAIAAYADDLYRQIAALPVGEVARRQALEASFKITRTASGRLAQALGAAMKDRRDVAFEEVLGVWREATASVVRASSAIPDALLGAIQTPNVLMAGRFEALGGVSYLKSLTASARDGGQEVAQILRTGIAANVSPQELAKRLRPYVAGAEEFERAFPKKDERFAALHTLRERKLPPELRNAAYKVRSNSLRIAYSEIHNARAEAELQAFAVDPLIVGVRWRLSPNRGTQGSPDACDGFAANDFYGLGRGVYPLDAVPLPPHPHDRCERMPVTRPPSEWHQPKPREMKPVLEVKDATLASSPGMAKLTPEQANRVRTQIAANLAASRDGAAGGGMRSLMAQGEKASSELVRGRVLRNAGAEPTPVEPTLAKRDRLPGWNGPTGPKLREQFTAVEAKASRLYDRITAEMDALVPRVVELVQADDMEGAQALGRRSAKLAARRHSIAERRDRIVQQLLRADTENTSRIEMADKFDRARRQNYERGVQRFRELWGDRVPASARFTIRARAGAFARRFLQGTSRSCWLEPLRTAFMDPGSGPGIMVHELTHGAEYAVPALHERAVAFRAARAAGERPVALRSLYPNYAFRADEVTLKDHYDERMGIGAAYAGKVYGHKATEILTMGVQWLIERPLEFARKDPEYFDFMIETLWGAW